MTNYEQLFKKQMKAPEFSKAYNDARLERSINEMLNSLKKMIVKNEPKESLLEAIDSIQKQIS